MTEVFPEHGNAGDGRDGGKPEEPSTELLSGEEETDSGQQEQEVEQARVTPSHNSSGPGPFHIVHLPADPFQPSSKRQLSTEEEDGQQQEKEKLMWPVPPCSPDPGGFSLVDEAAVQDQPSSRRLSSGAEDGEQREEDEEEVSESASPSFSGPGSTYLHSEVADSVHSSSGRSLAEVEEDVTQLEDEPAEQKVGLQLINLRNDQFSVPYYFSAAFMSLPLSEMQLINLHSDKVFVLDCSYMQLINLYNKDAELVPDYSLVAFILLHVSGIMSRRASGCESFLFDPGGCGVLSAHSQMPLVWICY